ncbi:unnamed protein product [Mytilus edulis]|uniref:VWFA domain-containing protein n=1 Tax=Mytilus edulis TaxID=6550 RepID=A0A8S3URL8_MYTED|nr:unnamed protein product [Mytilus edulis]
MFHFRIIIFYMIASHFYFVLPYKDTDYCRRRPIADIVFALDSSASIHRDQFRQQLQFVEQVVDKFPISENEVRVGLLTFSYHVYPAFNLNTYVDKKSLKHGIKRVAYVGEGTHTAEAIAYARDKMFSTQNGGRKLAPDILILITDGISENKTATIYESKMLKQKGVKTIVIGVSSGVDRFELQAIASTPSSRFVFSVDNFGSLKTIIDDLTYKTCKESKKAVSKKDRGERKQLFSRLTFVYDQVTTANFDRELRKSIALMAKNIDVHKTKMVFSLLIQPDVTTPQRRHVFLNNLQPGTTKSSRLRKLLKSLYKSLLAFPRGQSQTVVVFLYGKHLQNTRIFEELKRVSSMSELYVVKLSRTFYYKENELCPFSRHCVYTVGKKMSINDILGSIKQQICLQERC